MGFVRNWNRNYCSQVIDCHKDEVRQVVLQYVMMWFLRFSRRWLWRMPPSGVWHHVALRTDFSEERIISIKRVKRISELGTTLAVAANWRMLRIIYISSQRALVASLLLTFLLVQILFSLWWWWRYVLPKLRILQETHGVTSQKTALFI
jgi:hypothetical protein